MAKSIALEAVPVAISAAEPAAVVAASAHLRKSAPANRSDGGCMVCFVQICSLPHICVVLCPGLVLFMAEAICSHRFSTSMQLDSLAAAISWRTRDCVSRTRACKSQAAIAAGMVCWLDLLSAVSAGFCQERCCSDDTKRFRRCHRSTACHRCNIPCGRAIRARNRQTQSRLNHIKTATQSHHAEHWAELNRSGLCRLTHSAPVRCSPNRPTCPEPNAYESAMATTAAPLEPSVSVNSEGELWPADRMPRPLARRLSFHCRLLRSSAVWPPTSHIHIQPSRVRRLWFLFGAATSRMRAI